MTNAAPGKGRGACERYVPEREPDKTRGAPLTLSATECDGAGDRSWPGADGVPVIAALDDPLAICVAYDPAYVMGPHHDGSNGRSAGVCSVTRPGSGQIE